jgi:uncharacterized cupredoxin-like copper-binding protein
MTILTPIRGRVTRQLGVLLALGLTVVVTACGGASASAPSTPVVGTPVSTTGGVQELTVHGFDTMRFEPNVIMVRAGQPIELTFQNDGATDHDFALSEGVGQPVKIVAKGGQTSTATFTLDQPGTYTFTCSQFGHTAAGMKGTITAQ